MSDSDLIKHGLMDDPCIFKPSPSPARSAGRSGDTRLKEEPEEHAALAAAKKLKEAKSVGASSKAHCGLREMAKRS